MRDLRFQIGGQVDDVDGGEGTFLHTDTASYAESFRNESDLRVRGNFDAELARSNDRTRLLALLTTFLREVRSFGRTLCGRIGVVYLGFALYGSC